MGYGQGLQIDVKKQQGITLLELVLVVAIISVVVLVAIDRFESLARRADITYMQSASEVFSSGALLIHMKWVIAAKGADSPDLVKVPPRAIVAKVNKHGWPIATHKAEGVKQFSAEGCLSLWNGFFDNPTPAFVLGNVAAGQTLPNRYVLISEIGGVSPGCRFQFVGRSNVSPYFDYFVNTGQVRSRIPN